IGDRGESDLRTTIGRHHVVPVRPHVFSPPPRSWGRKPAEAQHRAFSSPPRCERRAVARARHPASPRTPPTRVGGFSCRAKNPYSPPVRETCAPAHPARSPRLRSQAPTVDRAQRIF